eukprot:Phypoly_transcript_15879.p1 GENE.Phypoly_transcript_15879~~Phypoly_transcript_15879.p1  ORF type:complete len:227 (+),score=59.51 Phypoly_transcript_15879:62-742(+)
MTSLMTMRSCTRVSGAVRYCTVPKRHNGFWAAVARQRTAQEKEDNAKYITSTTWASPLEKQVAVEELSKNHEELSKLGFWAGLKKIYQEGKQQALEEASKGRPPLPKCPESREDRRRVLEDYDIIPGSEEFKQFYAGHKQSELALETGVPDECIDDPALHISMIKFNRLKEFYKINTEEEERAFVEKFYISHGVQSLEAAFQGIIPEHTFTELPIIKEPPSDGAHH